MLWLALFACPRPVPAHLAVQPVPTTRPEVAITTVDDAVVAWMGGDPLVRRPRIPAESVLDGIEEADSLARLARTIAMLERTGGDVEQVLSREATLLTDRATPLVRGYLWNRAADALTRTPETADLVSRITPLRSAPSDASLEGDPLRFLEDAEARRRHGERWMLQSWLFRPDQPHRAIAAALASPQHAALAATPAGQLLTARGNEGDAEAALALLERATLASLQRAAADRDTEQAAWADTLLELREAHGSDPIARMLDEAFAGLLAGADDDEIAGAALVALAARRWLGTCPDMPCDGLDRTALFTAATAYGRRAEQLARLWQVIALKDALDTMEVGHDSVIHPTAVRQLVDALHGTGAGPFDASLLMRDAPAPATWLSLSRGTGGDDAATDWPTTRNSLAAHIVRVVDDAMIAVADGPAKPLLERIRSRAAR
jgi:hypothetical protein